MLSKKSISLLIKIIIVLMAVFFLYKQIEIKADLEFFDYKHIRGLIEKNSLLFLVVCVLMFFNWLLEAIKWKYLIKKIEVISINRSFRAILTGITVSTFTPNRIGEYGGRIFCLEEGDRIKAVLITILGNMGQLLITILFGSIGLIFLPQYMPEFDHLLNNSVYFLLVSAVLFLNTILVILYLNTSKLSKISFLKNFFRYFVVFNSYSTKELVNVLLLSTMRYIVFTTQFFILLKIFTVNISYIDAIVLIMNMLLIVSVIPTIALTEIGVRGSVAVYLFGLLPLNISGVLSATLLLWLVNLIFPAIIGVLFIFTLKFFRKE